MSKALLPLPNQQPVTLSINLHELVQHRGFEVSSPYNVFLEGQKTLILLANKNPNDALSIQLLTLGLSSLIEHYFRSILSKAVLLCSESLASAFKNVDVSLAAANYYKGEELGRAIFDSANFSDNEIILEVTKKYLNVSISKNSASEVFTALADLQKIFILRHAVVHSHGFLSPKNLIELKLNHHEPTVVSATHKAFENMVEVALNSIQSYNSFIYKCLLGRAVKNERISFNDTEEDRGEFFRYWSLFSGKDAVDYERSAKELYDLTAAHFSKA